MTAEYQMDKAMEREDLSELTNEQLCVRYQKGDRNALDQLVRKNSRLVYKIAVKLLHEYAPETLTLEDFYIEGNIGLMDAALKFDDSLGYRFSTYACWWIRQKIVRAAVNDGYMMRLPVHVFDKVAQVNKCRKARNPESTAQLQQFLKEETGVKYPLEKLEEYIYYIDKFLSTASLNETVGSEEGNADCERISFIRDRFDMESHVEDCRMQEDVRDALKGLTERERAVLEMRYGLGGETEMTLEQIGGYFHLTRERIRQIEVKALRKLAQGEGAVRLQGYLRA